MPNLLPILRTQFVLIKCQSSATSGFEALELLYGMQGVRSSSLLGSILQKQVRDSIPESLLMRLFTRLVVF